MHYPPSKVGNQNCHHGDRSLSTFKNNFNYTIKHNTNHWKVKKQKGIVGKRVINGDHGAYFRCLFLMRTWRLTEAASPLRSTVISRERPLAEVPGRCDAVAVAVGLTDRKHVGVVGANRDAAAAKGDREYLHPVHISAPLEPQGFPHRLVCL